MDKCKALIITRDAKGNIISATNLWHEQARLRSIAQADRTKAQLKIIRAKARNCFSTRGENK